MSPRFRNLLMILNPESGCLGSAFSRWNPEYSWPTPTLFKYAHTWYPTVFSFFMTVPSILILNCLWMPIKKPQASGQGDQPEVYAAKEIVIVI